jgi:hypothetical protein
MRAVWFPSSSGNGSYRSLENKGIDELRTIPLSASVMWYTVRGLFVEFRGNPADADVIPFDYFARLDTLVNPTDGTSNNVLQAHEEIYVSAALFFLHRYCQDMDIAQAYLDSFNAATKGVNEAATFRVGSQSPNPTYNFSSRSAY